MVCAERTMGMEIILGVPDGTLGEVGQVEAHLVCLQVVLTSAQDSELGGTLGVMGQVEARFSTFGDSVNLNAI